jgi:hypothetical protein
MAVKKNSKLKVQNSKLVEDFSMPVMEEPKKKKSWATDGKLVVLGWSLLLIGGLAHMLPAQMEPLLKFAKWGISVQMLVGMVSVIIALNFLLGDEE